MNAVAMNWTISQKRETVARIGTVLAGLFILFLVKTVVMSQDAPMVREPVHLTLIAPPVQPEIEKQVEKVQPQPHRLEKAEEPPRVVTPVIAAPAALTEPVVVPVLPPTLPKENIAPAHVEPQVQRVSNGLAEGAFAQDVRSRIERKKIYPDTARDLGMSGEVEVLYELDRTGGLLKAEIVISSGYKLLDQAALRAVKSAIYPKFPEDAWIGAVSKVFRTKSVFSINQ